MTTNTREWGVTLLRVWFGLIIAQRGLSQIRGIFSPFRLASGGVGGVWDAFASAPAAHAAALVLLIGGAAILLGVAVRLAALLAAATTLLPLWERTHLLPGALLDDWPSTSLLVVSVAFLMLGSGRLNLGSLFGRK